MTAHELSSNCPATAPLQHVVIDCEFELIVMAAVGQPGK